MVHKKTLFASNLLDKIYRENYILLIKVHVPLYLYFNFDILDKFSQESIIYVNEFNDKR